MTTVWPIHICAVFQPGCGPPWNCRFGRFLILIFFIVITIITFSRKVNTSGFFPCFRAKFGGKQSSQIKTRWKRKKILIVEDDEFVANQMKWALAANYDVFVAEDRPPAWKR